MNSAAYERVWLIFGLVSVPVWLTAFNVFGADKLVDQTLFKHDPSAGGVYRWSEAALLNLDGFGRKSLADLKKGLRKFGYEIPEADG